MLVVVDLGDGQTVFGYDAVHVLIGSVPGVERLADVMLQSCADDRVSMAARIPAERISHFSFTSINLSGWFKDIAGS